MSNKENRITLNLELPQTSKLRLQTSNNSMKNPLHHFLLLTFLFVSLSLHAQQPRYSAEIEKRIKQVEDNLFPAVRV